MGKWVGQGSVGEAGLGIELHCICVTMPFWLGIACVCACVLLPVPTSKLAQNGNEKGLFTGGYSI